MEGDARGKKRRREPAGDASADDAAAAALPTRIRKAWREGTGGATAMGEPGAVRFSHTWDEHKGLNAATFKSGPWEAEEDALLRTAFGEFASLHGLDDAAQKVLIVDGARASDLPDCWKFVAEHFQFRTLRAIRKRGERLLHPGNNQGAWSSDEQATLLRLVAKYGKKWRKIGKKMQRYPQDLMGYYARLAVPEGATRETGIWTSTEEDSLVELVRRYGTRVAGGSGGYKSIPWGVIAEQLGSRHSSACKLKWDYNNFGAVRLGIAWSAEVDRALLAAIAASGAETPTEVPWHALIPGRTGPSCKLRFGELCTAHAPYGMGFTESLDCLLEAAPRFAAGEAAAAAPARKRRGKEAAKSRRRGDDDEEEEATAEGEEGVAGAAEVAAPAAATDDDDDDDVAAAAVEKRERKRLKREKRAAAEAAAAAEADAAASAAAFAAAEEEKHERKKIRKEQKCAKEAAR